MKMTNFEKEAIEEKVQEIAELLSLSSNISTKKVVKAIDKVLNKFDKK